MLYKFWLSRAERERLDKEKRLVKAKAMMAKVPEAINIALRYDDDKSKWHEYAKKGGLRDQLEAILREPTDKVAQEFDEKLSGKYWNNWLN